MARPIESLIDLPLMTDPEQQAAMQVLSALLDPPTLPTSICIACSSCRMVNISMQHGTSGASAHAYGYWGIMLGPVFHRYREGYRFAKLACDLVEKHGFIAYQAKVYRLDGGGCPLDAADHDRASISMRAAFRAASETGDLTYACYSMYHLVINPSRCGTIRSTRCGASRRGAWTSSGKPGTATSRTCIVSQQRFIATMQGRTATFSTFSDAQFDEAAFEAQLTADGDGPD